MEDFSMKRGKPLAEWQIADAKDAERFIPKDWPLANENFEAGFKEFEEEMAQGLKENKYQAKFEEVLIVIENGDTNGLAFGCQIGKNLLEKQKLQSIWANTVLFEIFVVSIMRVRKFSKKNRTNFSKKIFLLP